MKITVPTQQREVMRLTAEGLTVREIAQVMGLAYPTVRNYRAILYRKFGVRTVGGLIHAALAAQVLPLPTVEVGEDWP